MPTFESRYGLIAMAHKKINCSKMPTICSTIAGVLIASIIHVLFEKL